MPISRTSRADVRTDRDILESAAKAVAEHAKNASAIVDEAHNGVLDGSHPVTLDECHVRPAVRADHDYVVVRAVAWTFRSITPKPLELRR
jgi:hypothetical protein